MCYGFFVERSYVKNYQNANEEQLKAIRHDQGPLLVLAGPGTGKTFVITMRTRFLIDECHVRGNNILVVTFTKAAAKEMQSRYEQNRHSNVQYATFHSLFFKMLRYAYGYQVSQIIKDEECYALLKEIVRELSYEMDDINELVRVLKGQISYYKMKVGIEKEEFEPTGCENDVFWDVYKRYQEYLLQKRKIDFDDILVLTDELLRERKDILEFWQNQFHYIMVDEAQDCNLLEYQTICLLANQNNNIVFVGDDDQSLYRFCGAKSDILLGFRDDFQEGKIINLKHNYRSNPTIIKKATRLISQNEKRYQKELYATKKEMDRKEEVAISEHPSHFLMNKAILEAIEKLLVHVPHQEIAVLYRTNRQSIALASIMAQYNIPIIIKDKTGNTYEHWVARDIIAYLRLALGVGERVDYLSIINRPKRYISREAVLNIKKLEDLMEAYIEKPYVIERINHLKYDLLIISRIAPAAAIHYIRKTVGYEAFLREYAKEKAISFNDLQEILDFLEESAKEFKTIQEWFDYIAVYKKEFEKQSSMMKSNKGITFMTFHSSKGLEFKYVFIIDAMEGITPHNRALTQEDIEEERRMFYVAMTRAKEKLWIYYSKERYNKEQQKSRFIDEIEETMAGKDSSK